MKVLSITIGCVCAVLPVTSAQNLVPNDDVTVRPGRGNLNASSPLGLLVKADGSASFVEFTFGAAPAVVATLRLYNFWSNAGVPVNYNVRIRGGVFAFDEQVLTHATQPDDSAWTIVASSFHVGNEPATYEFDITGFHNDHLGETVTFSLRSVSGSGDGPIFEDREGTGGTLHGPVIERGFSEAPPVIAEVEPDPETVEAGLPYERQLLLLEGAPPVSWSIVHGPAELTIDASGTVSGWTPGPAAIDQTFAMEVEATNAFGSDREAWQVFVVEAPPNPLVGGGWIAHYYKPSGEVTTFPDYDALLPASTGLVPSIDVAQTDGQFIPHGLAFVDDFAVRYEGRITLPEGITTFHVTSEGGVRLLAGGALVLENAGGFTETSGSVDLAAGEHCLVVEYFAHTGPAGIRVEYTPPGGVRSVIPPSVMRADPCISGSVRVPVWGMFEISLTACGTPANPFTDIELTAEVLDPDSAVRVVDGYYDGDGRGGQQGNIWKLRLAPDRPGLWHWTARSNDAALDGQEGSFESLTAACPGPIAANGRHFVRTGAGPVYLLGNFLDRAAPANEEYSHTLLSEGISASNRQDMITRHRDFHRANKMNVYVANRGDYGGIATTPWLGSAGSNDKSRFDLARWRMYDEIVAQLRDEGMVAELWFFADDSDFGNLPDADRQRLTTYGMARLSPYAHTMFVLALEWQEGWSQAEVRTNAAYVQDHNPWQRLASVHGTTGNFAFPGDAWADFMATQSGNSITPAGNNAHTIANRGLSNKPLIVEEFGILEAASDARLRGNLWAAFCGGAAGSGTGSDLARLRVFLDDTGVPFWRMSPDNTIASRGFVLAEQGNAYVVYVQDGSPFTVQLEEGLYAASWFDPRGNAGEPGLLPAGTVTGGVQSFTPPESSDWVLYVVSTVCPDEGDTHCTGLTITGPPGDVEGIFTATATAADTGGDVILYTFAADNGIDPVVTVGPQTASTAAFVLTAGSWIMSVTVDDDLNCDDAAPDATCSVQVSVAPASTPFRRADANADGDLNIADAVYVLSYLFASGPAPTCDDAADANDNGGVDISDGVYILQNLFANGPAIPPPYPACGIDTTEDDLQCDEYPACQ